ncbi:MAG TPA: chemotaxis protein [Solimonas sp.]|jgi:two-component system chemotaxis response regulator CheV|uniref:Chemotaxis protein CheV n=1 Tax=Stutzerimonas degradans TaxID=2968968 RepID=A0A1S8F3B5_9GAMM|nr:MULTISPECIES: chemotaxis protein [Pseudomonadaceae]MDT3711687.1 chemotaxis protein [Pseudomonadaceae bacterium]KGK85713.1 chemotaxis protein CheW [Stutzerimonas degradans]MCQ4235345.1 chemotaxis protein [Stutzerimonas degradans]MCQ4267487.1 chemotaxis protein [Stutzerimonas degradans]MCQ4273826.1 chemotaxis protein [Stutzerimonas degradans]
MSNSYTADSLSLLLFTLRSGKQMAINLLKVSEIIPMPRLTRLPEAHPHIEGVATLRGEPLSVIDLSQAIGMAPLEDPRGGCLVVTEISRQKHGLHVQAVARIVSCATSKILPPPYGAKGRSFITGTAEVDGELIQVLDIEKVLHNISPASAEADLSDLNVEDAQLLTETRALIVDDSQVARSMSLAALGQLGVTCHAVTGARAALARLDELHGGPEEINVVVSDIEMPEMDGYAFTQALRQHPTYAGIYVLLHTSLDSTISTDRAKAVGANEILTKFSVPELTRCILNAARAIHRR